MNKKIVGILIVSMCFALIGIVFIQVYWIRMSIKMRNEEFGFSVNEALNGVSKRLEQNEQLQFAKKRFVLAEPKGIQNLQVRSKQMTMELNVKKGKRYVKYFMVDTIQKSSHSTSTTSIQHTRSGIKKDSTYQLNSNLVIVKTDDEKINNKTNGIFDILKKYVSENEQTKLPLLERIPLITLSQTIRQELKNNGIDVDFEYRINSGDPVDSTVYQTISFPTKMEANPYRISLYPNDLIAQNAHLALYFPAKKSYIISTIWGMLLLSILFTLIIFFIFIYTVRVILKQKKLADIKNDFINNMTHELKTPIATISLAVDAVNNPVVLQDQQKIIYYSGIIREENKRMHAQVEKVLQVALTEKPDFEMERKALDLYELVKQILNSFELQISEKNADIDLSLNAINHQIKGDAFHLLHAISNLVDNALKYSGSEPQIGIKTWSEGNNLILQVSDKGIGMSKETRKRIFDKFYRAQSGNIHDIKGFGLGLSYSKIVIEKHGGSIAVESELNRGAVFTLIFETT